MNTVSNKNSILVLLSFIPIILSTFFFSAYAKESETPITIIAVSNNIPFRFNLADGSATDLYVEFLDLLKSTQ